MSDSPPSSWYEPREPRHRNKTIIQENCDCSECHEGHLERGEVEENSDNTDFPCCVDQMDTWIEDGIKCEKHPTAYVEPKTKTEPMHCEICEPETL